MPAAPRPSNKATKIAYRILGMPDNMRHLKENNARSRKRSDYLYAPPMYGVIK